jgi:hypothetical protein
MRFLFIILFALAIQSCKGQDSTYFEVQKVSCNVLGYESTGVKIVLKNAPTTVCSYDTTLFKSRSEKEIFQMVDELLSYQGDTTLCALKVNNYNPLRSQIYMGANKRYTLQLEALFIINQLCMSKPFNYSSYPLLYDKRNKSYIHGTEKDAMSNIYEKYKAWFDEVKNIGLKEARKRKLDPLENSNYKWY